MLEGRAIQVADVQAELDEFPEVTQAARTFGLRTMVSVPLIREGAALGVIQLRRTEVNPFTDTKEALEQQTATSEILGVIGASPTDVQPVFDAIARSCVRLCHGAFSGVFRFDGELIHLAS